MKRPKKTFTEEFPYPRIPETHLPDSPHSRVLEPCPLIPETLTELRWRGFPMAVVTDAHNGNALARLRKTDLFCYFDYVISYDMTGAKKPAPDAFLLALKMLQTLNRRRRYLLEIASDGISHPHRWE
ncbi:MAG: HAD hydrolase-like protein [Methanomicrobiales archaeon]